MLGRRATTRNATPPSSPASRSASTSASTPRWRRGTTVAAVAALSIGLGLASSACTGTGAVRAGNAAQVGDRTVSVSYVQDQTRKLAALTGQKNLASADIANLQRAVLGQVVDEYLTDGVAASAGIDVTPAQVARSEKDIRGAITAKQLALPEDMVPGFARWWTQRQQLNIKLLGHTPTTQADQTKAQSLVTAAIGRQARQVGVEVNPRFGSWSDAKAQLVAEGGALAGPATTPTPAPSVPGSAGQ